MEDETLFQKAMKNAPVAKMVDSSGKESFMTPGEASSMGVSTQLPAQGAKPIYHTEGKWSFSAPESSLSLSLDESTGNIKLRAPKSITESEDFKRVFDADTFKAYSAAYKSNPNYKVEIEDVDEKTGEVSTKEVTIPEWIKNRESALKNYAKSLNAVNEKRNILMRKYGEKAKNMTSTDIIMSEQSDKYTYLPEVLKGVSVFGDDPNKKNAFKKILDKVGENGEISVEDLKEVYTRGNFGRTELAGVIATIDGYLRGSDWSKDEYYTDEDTGEKIYNKASAKEAAKLLAFRDFLVSHHPEGNWFEEIGGNIETLSINAMHGATRLWANIANLGEMAFTLNKGQTVKSYIEGMDKTVGQYNQDQALTSDATQLMATIGYIGGTLLAGKAAGALAKNFASGVSKVVGGKIGSVLERAAEAHGLSTPEELLADMAVSADKYTLGARVVLSFSTAREKAQMATSLYNAFMSNHQVINFMTELALDTFHDALLYDTNNLRDAISGSSSDVASFWLSQFSDNTKWWAGINVGKGVIKLTNKTTLGKALNIRTTKLVNKVAAKIGEHKAQIKNSLHGGSIVEDLDKKIKKAADDKKIKKENRLKKKLEQENFNKDLRDARAQLGNLSLEWDGLKLTEESYDKYKDAVSHVKAMELGVDRYNRNIEYQRQLAVGAQVDPSTGKVTFINPTLGNANVKATDFYVGMTDLAKKYNLTLADKSLISQDMIDYWVGRYYERLASNFAKNSTDKGKRALEALPIIRQNNEALKSVLPKEITAYIDNGVNSKMYQNWYSAMNEYGSAKGIFNREKISSYENNPIWKDAGYMPIVVELPESRYRMVDVEGRLNAKIDRDFEDLQFEVAEGQHYVDPELTRQNRLSEMCQIEVNNQLFKSYSGFGSNATNVTKISGEETEYVRHINEGKKYLETAVDQISVEKIKKLEIPIVKVRRRKPIKYSAVSPREVDTIVSSMSPEQVNNYLVRHKVLGRGETFVNNKVDATNYSDWYKEQSDATKKFLVQQYNEYGVGLAKAGNAENYRLFQKAAEEGGADFEEALQRSVLRGNEGFAKSPLANETRHNLNMGREAFYQGVTVAEVKSHLRNVKNVDISPLVDDMAEDFSAYIDDFTNSVLENEGAKSAINTLSEASEASYDFGKYIALRKLQEGGLADVYTEIDKRIDASVKKLKDIDANDVNLIKEQAHILFDDILDSNIDEVSQVVRATNPDLVDTKYIYKKADEINKRINAFEDEIKRGDNTNMVMYLDDAGRQVFAEVDPAFASLFNYRYKLDKTDASMLAKINAATSKVFRYGTTSVNLSSFGNQLFRDFGNALLVGGSWHTIKYYRNDLVDVFGQNIVDQIGRFDPTGYEMKQLTQVAEATGQTIQEAAVSRELMRGAAISPTTTEHTLYKNFMKEAYRGDSDLTLREMRNAFQKVVDKFDVDDFVNGKRENYLRNRVFASSLDDAMKSGYNLEQARVFAEFAMNNATTNFSRQIYHLQAIADSTPYFRAAINGTKSFWRMWSLDPVGITGRITGGLIIPVMYLTGASLGSEENRKVYENIPEYQKADSLVFVINGQIYSAPMPQEIAPIVAPFRQFVEYLHGTNKNDFWELMMNDALGFFPYDLQGFSTIDMDKMISDPTIFDRIDRGVARVFSQMAPIPLKSTYMLATGTDPYSGKNLRNPEYSFWNEETNSVETMDYNQNSFAKFVASLPFFKDWVTPSLAEKVISGTVGVTNSHLLGDLTALVSEGGEKFMSETMTNIGNQITKPFSVDKYNLVDAIWKRAVRELTAEKDSILNSQEMKTINNKLSQEKDPEKRKALLSERQNLVNDFHQKVGDTVKRLESEYNGTFDRSKFAAVIQLLNFNTDAPYQSASQYSSDLATSQYYEGRDSAIHTMQSLGIDGTHDTSVFGYLAEDQDGNIVMKYSNPVAIMDMTNTWSNQKDYHLANIKALASQNNLWDDKKAVDEQVDSIYAKKKLKDSDYDAIDAIYVNWNAKVMSALAPYVSEMTPEAAINNQQVLNYLAGLIEVPGDYKKDKYGKYVTSSKLGEGSATQAYIRSYIKNIFNVNDTTYSGGKNYSSRKQYDKENNRWI